jgi:hypothetical protein
MHYRNTKGPYKLTHKHHPVSLAVQDNSENYNWLLNHLKALCREYTFRYGKVHKCEQYISTFEESAPTSNGDVLTLPNCTPFKDQEDTITAYRICLVNKWANDKIKPKWSGPSGGRLPPSWATDSALIIDKWVVSKLK